MKFLKPENGPVLQEPGSTVAPSLQRTEQSMGECLLGMNGRIIPGQKQRESHVSIPAQRFSVALDNSDLWMAAAPWWEYWQTEPLLFLTVQAELCLTNLANFILLPLISAFYFQAVEAGVQLHWKWLQYICNQQNDSESSGTAGGSDGP